MAFGDPPSLAGFITFLRNVVGITTTALPDSSPVIPMAYEVSLAIVNLSLALTPVYAFAVYNLGADRIYNFANDLPGAATVQGSDPPQAFFAYARKTFNIYGNVSGTVQSTGDESTNVSLVVPDFSKEFTLADLQNMKTPYGRTYLGLAQQYGPTIWGLS